MFFRDRCLVQDALAPVRHIVWDFLSVPNMLRFNATAVGVGGRSWLVLEWDGKVERIGNVAERASGTAVVSFFHLASELSKNLDNALHTLRPALTGVEFRSKAGDLILSYYPKDSVCFGSDASLQIWLVSEDGRRETDSIEFILDDWLES